jgi:hypothetical protein
LEDRIMTGANGGPVLERLDLNLLVTLEAVYRERKLTRAAKRRFVTQSAVLARPRSVLRWSAGAAPGSTSASDAASRTPSRVAGPRRVR